MHPPAHLSVGDLAPLDRLRALPDVFADRRARDERDHRERGAEGDEGGGEPGGRVAQPGGQQHQGRSSRLDAEHPPEQAAGALLLPVGGGRVPRREDGAEHDRGDRQQGQAEGPEQESGHAAAVPEQDEEDRAPDLRRRDDDDRCGEREGAHELATAGGSVLRRRRPAGGGSGGGGCGGRRGHGAVVVVGHAPSVAAPRSGGTAAAGWEPARTGERRASGRGACRRGAAGAAGTAPA
ncbi:hypothetical protein [Frigoribacterium sp. PhB116]|uniref:hypothetical protein n=1 Tax=Frigoribacterium sp. PhB116 TaxID=2485174 RepID=UPI00105EE2B1|nr:hypothetical protein [Frigoribacterium sp. PhB116]